jgi:galactonate dehydratase
LKEIAAMAEPYLVAVSPHNYNSTTLALAATVQACATMPNFICTEYFIPFAAFAERVCPNQYRPKDGYIELRDTPGLGVDIDERALEQYPWRQLPPKAMRRPQDEL